MNPAEIVKAKLAEWNITPSEEDLAQLIPAYENLMVWQQVVEEMLESRPMSDGMEMPTTEPAAIHDLTRYR
jgi:hypothetical protein